MLTGDKNGIAIWNKLGNHPDGAIQAYFKSLMQAAEKYQKIYFSDFDEQRKKILNNQNTYCMHYNQQQQKWVIELFIETIKV